MEKCGSLRYIDIPDVQSRNTTPHLIPYSRARNCCGSAEFYTLLRHMYFEAAALRPALFCQQMQRWADHLAGLLVQLNAEPVHHIADPSIAGARQVLQLGIGARLLCDVEQHFNGEQAHRLVACCS